MPFAIPRIWREPTNHHDNCYFCMVDISKYKKPKDRKKIVYPNIPSSIAPVNHGPKLPIPNPPQTNQAISSNLIRRWWWWFWCSMFQQSSSFSKPKRIRRFNLRFGSYQSKSRDTFFTSQRMEFTWSKCKISKPRKRHVTFASFYAVSADSEHPTLCYCTDILGLFQQIGIQYAASDWCLFIDSSKRSLKAVLLYNGNIYPSIPVAHSVQMKEIESRWRYCWNWFNTRITIGMYVEILKWLLVW